MAAVAVSASASSSLAARASEAASAAVLTPNSVVLAARVSEPALATPPLGSATAPSVSAPVKVKPPPVPTLVIQPTVVPAFRQRSGWRPSGVEPVAPRSTGAPPEMNLARLVGLVMSKPRCRRMEVQFG